MTSQTATARQELLHLGAADLATILDALSDAVEWRRPALSSCADCFALGGARPCDDHEADQQRIRRYGDLLQRLDGQ